MVKLYRLSLPILPRRILAPLPTNCFFQNFTLKNGDQPEYIHPYSVRSAAAGLTVCYPSRSHSPSFDIQTFAADLTVSSPSDAAAAGQPHRVVAFDDLSITLEISPSLRAFLVRGCPFVTVATAEAAGPVDVSVASVHAFLEAAPYDDVCTKWRLRMNSGQTFLLYASAPIGCSEPRHLGDPGSRRHPDCLPPDPPWRRSRPRLAVATRRGGALNKPFYIDYTWRKRWGWGSPCSPTRSTSGCSPRTAPLGCSTTSRSIDGDLVGVVGDSWVLKTDPLSPTWHSTRGVNDDGVDEVVVALRKDVDSLASSPITTTYSYFYGKAIARAARLALIAEKVGCPEVIPRCIAS
ncbi:hypothetical protein ZWY2020_014912 [Hordeum vulgare]|nr:hypothetical protein ZWY2020_014912 [Hordeum vulgare]